jgi:hypothetical protein
VEDVWPTWLGKRVTKQDGITVYGSPGAPSSVTSRRTVTYVARAKIVCKECNNMWMSDIETRASEYLKPILFGSLPLALEPNAQRRIAAWALLKTLTLPYCSTDSDQIPTEHYPAFYRSKMPWNQHRIFIAKYDGRQASGFRSILFDITRKDGARIVEKAKLYGFTFQIRALVIQMVGVTATSHIPVRLPAVFAPYVVPVWPTTASIAWPPERIFNEEQLPAFFAAFLAMQTD